MVGRRDFFSARGGSGNFCKNFKKLQIEWKKIEGENQPAGSFPYGEHPERADLVNFRHGLIFLLTRYDFLSTISMILEEQN